MGFEALQTNAAAALPELTRMLEDTNQALIAMQCLFSIGKPAEAAILATLTNVSPELRRFSAENLARVTDDVEVLFDRLKQPLGDPDAMVRLAAIHSAGIQTHAPNESVPLLIKALGDQNERVAAHAARLLTNFGPNTKCACNALSNLVVTGGRISSRSALKSLFAINPEGAEPLILSLMRSESIEKRFLAVGLYGNAR